MNLATVTELKLRANEGRDEMIQSIRALRELLIEEATRLLDVERGLRELSDPALGLPALQQPDDMEVASKALVNLGRTARGDMETNGAQVTT